MVKSTLSLIEIMRALRDEEAGCPWDREQTFETIAPYTIEEAYEVADAIARKDMDELRDELGDLLFQVVFHSQMAHEAGYFQFNDVVESITRKMLRRHPHVFADDEVTTAEEQSHAWERHKAAERQAKGSEGHSQLDGVALGLPALLRAEKLQKRAARVGFDWPDLTGVVEKLEEELDEVKSALAQDEGLQRITEEMGDLLFSCVNLARKAGVDAETALRHANQKFDSRFRYIERQLKTANTPLEQATLDEMERLWLEAKTCE